MTPVTATKLPEQLACQAETLTPEQVRIRDLERDRDLLLTGCIIEIAVRNPAVADHMRHWEGRAIKAESDLSTALEESKGLREEVERLRMLDGLRTDARAVMLKDADTVPAYLEWLGKPPQRWRESFGGNEIWNAATEQAESRVEELRKGWQPIETAPKDGTHVLLGVAGKLPVRGFFAGRWRMHSDGNNIILLTGAHEPTHWQPLPAAPPSSQPT